MKQINYAFFFLLLTIVSCRQSNIELTDSHKNKEDIFGKIDSISLTGIELKEVMGITVTKNNDIIICSYNAGKVMLFDSTGRYKRDIISNEIPIFKKHKIGYPLAITEDEKGNIYVSDNKYRRIFILNDNYQYANSFIISGHHISPISLSVRNNQIFMGGCDKETGNYLHAYTPTGLHIRSFRKSEVDFTGLPHFSPILNYPFLWIGGNTIFSVESMDYNLTASDLKGNTIFSSNYRSPLYTKDVRPFLEKIKTDFAEIDNQISKQFGIYGNGKKLFIKHGMPIPNYKEGEYYYRRRFMLDLLGLKGEPMAIGVNTGNEDLFQIKGDVAFFLSYTAKHNFQIKRYKIK